MAVVVTGTSGYVGHALALRLADNGEKVYAQHRSTPGEQLKAHPNIHLIKSDVTKPDALIEVLHECSCIYHLAACSKNWAKDPTTFYRTNVEGTVRMMDAAVEKGVSKFVYTSSGGVIGPQINGSLVNENTKRETGFFNEYERTKYLAEQEVRKYAREGLNAVIVNATRLFGPGLMNGGNIGTRLMDKYIRGKWKFIPGDGTSVGNYGYIEDVIQGHILAMEKGKPGERYILGGENVDYNVFFQTLGEVSGKEQKLHNMSTRMLLFAAGCIQVFTRITNLAPPMLPSDVKKYSYNWGTDISKAKTELGYTVTPFREAIKKTIDWLEQRGQ